MKRNIIVCVLLATMAAGGTGVWAGNDNSGDPSASDKPCHCTGRDPGMPLPPSPEALVDHMTRQLRLTGDQQAKIKALFVKDREKTELLHQNLAENRKQLQAAMKSATFDEASIRAIAAKQAQTEVELTVAKARLRNQVNTLLTPEQRALAEKCPPPFHHGQGPQLAFDYGRGPRSIHFHEEGPGHMPPPPPCGDHGGHHPDADYDGE